MINYPIFYQNDIESNHILNEEDTSHCIKVLRKKTSDKIHVVDGKGGLFTCEIQEIGKKNVVLKILSVIKEFQKKDFYLHIVLAPTKNAERLEWFVEKATEIGIDEISLILTEHSERKFQKTERLEKIAVGAMKQSQKAYLPKINELQPLAKFLEKVPQTQKFVAHYKEGAESLNQLAKSKYSVCILIGPEGDFSANEIEKVSSAGFQICTLGNARLRTETAALVACTLVNSLNY